MKTAQKTDYSSRLSVNGNDTGNRYCDIRTAI